MKTGIKPDCPNCGCPLTHASGDLWFCGSDLGCGAKLTVSPKVIFTPKAKAKLEHQRNLPEDRRVCPQCGSEFWAPPDGRTATKRFCSTRCRNKNWVDKHPRLPKPAEPERPEWWDK